MMISFPTPFGAATLTGGILPGSDPGITPRTPLPKVDVETPVPGVKPTVVPSMKPFEHNEAKPTQESANIPVTTEALRNPLFTVSDMRHPGQMPDVSHVNPDLLGKFTDLQNATGLSMPILSGYRGETYNRTHGGAQHSQHLTGNAIDVDVSKYSIPQQQEIIKTAREKGITGIGVYGRSLHFDLGRMRAWGPNHSHTSLPDWAREVLS